jgi:hypothetical protein
MEVHGDHEGQSSCRGRRVMPAFVDLSDKSIGKWRVIARVPNSSPVMWTCACACDGAMHKVRSCHLVSGRSTSCGCDRDAKSIVRFTKHGHSKKQRSRTYITWKAMLQRCYNKKNPNYPKYGGAGVRVCARWHTFQNFLVDKGERPSGKTIDRWPNRDGDYTPENTRWATPSEQRRNQNQTKLTAHSAKKIFETPKTESSKSVGARFGVSSGVVRKIRRGLIWKGAA